MNHTNTIFIDLIRITNPTNPYRFLGTTQNEHSSCKYKSPNPSCAKKIKEHNNAKIKIAETKKKLHHLISQLKSFDKCLGDAKSSVCTGRTVKEITDYFENISKNESNMKHDSQVTSSKDSWDTKSLPYEKNNSIPTLSKTTFPYSHVKKNMMSKKFNQRDLNLHLMWKEKLQAKSLHYKQSEVRSVVCKGDNMLSSIRDSVKASFISCVLMLQYIM